MGAGRGKGSAPGMRIRPHMAEISLGRSQFGHKHGTHSVHNVYLSPNRDVFHHQQ